MLSPLRAHEQEGVEVDRELGSPTLSRCSGSPIPATRRLARTIVGDDVPMRPGRASDLKPRGVVPPFLVSVGSAVAGPALIVACILIVMRGFVVGAMVSSQHVDILPMWTPTFSFLGRSLASGHIPAWNPYVMGGVPFAADPQSGWTYLPAMLLFSVFSTDVAIRWFIVLQPVLAGLGIYWFLRAERLEPAASTVGGLSLGLVIAHSVIALGLPFAATMAWTAMLLASAAHLVHARGWPGRLGWAIVTALCWGQLANAHLSNGLVMGSVALASYLSAALFRAVRKGAMSGRERIEVGVLTLVALPLVNLAVLLPRLAYLPSTTIGAGYNKLDAWGTALTGVSTRGGVVGLAAGPAWPAGLAMPPGPYLGVLAILLSLAWWTSPRYRWLGAPIAGFGSLFYLLSLNGIARALAPLISNTAWGQFYLHEPYRFTYATIFALCVLAGLGADSLLRATSLRASLQMLAPGAALWIIMWAIATPKREDGLIVVGIAASVVCIAKLRHVPVLRWGFPAIVAFEMTAAGLIGQGRAYVSDGQPLRTPTVDAAAYVRPGPISEYLAARGGGGGRYVPFLPRLGQYGFEGLQGPVYWGLLANQRSMIFSLPDVDGYNPTQSVRYWTFVRALDPKPMHYNAAFLSNPPPIVIDLLAIHWVITSGKPPAWATDDSSASPSSPVRVDGPWSLYAIPGAAPAVSVVDRWTTVATPAAALSAVRAVGFDPGRTAVLERDPGLSMSSGTGSGSASLITEGTGAATIDATTPVSGLLVIRIPYQGHWHAWIDGRPTPVIPADYLDMAVAIPAGHHTVRIAYSDPTIGYGIAGSAVSILALVSGSILLRRRTVPANRP
jgi:hypothetical protein